MKIAYCATLLISSAFLISDVFGKDVPVLDPVIVSASHLPAKASQTTSNSTVITREQILEQNPATVAELLQSVPGLHLNRAGGKGGLSSIFIRGADPNFTMILINGVQVNNPNDTRGGTFNVTQINPLSIQRIEIVRGALSSVYGSEALGGVINIITKSGERIQAGGARKIQSDASAGLGSHGYKRTGASLSIPMASGNVSVSAGYIDVGSGTPGTESKTTDVTGKASLVVGDDLEIDVFGRYMRNMSERFPDDSGGPDLAVFRQAESQNSDDIILGLDVSDAVTEWWSVKTSTSYFENSSKISTPGVAAGVRNPFGIPSSETDDNFQRFKIGLNNTLTVHDDVSVALGVDVRTENGKSQGSFVSFGTTTPTSFNLSRSTVGAYGEIRYSRIAGLTVDAALRWDGPEDEASQFSPHVGLVYELAKTRTIFRTNWREGFKLPSFFALANPVVGNPSLVPETSQSYDFGVEQRLGNKLTLDATVFRNDFSNLVDFDAGPPPKLVNRSRVRTEGVEIDAKLHVTTNVRATAFFTYAKTQNQDTGESLRSRPKLRGGGSVNWSLRKDLGFDVRTTYVGDFLDSSVPTGERTLGNYFVTDLSATWKPIQGVNFRAAIDNLFDTNYQETIGFPGGGISARFDAQISF